MMSSTQMTLEPDYKYERERLRTFQSWPANAKVEAWKMARAGLLYTGQDEDVKCSWCGVILGDWQYGEQVMARHRLASPQCPFVLNTSDNVPCVQEPEAEMSLTNQSPVSVTIPEDADDVGPATPRLLTRYNMPRVSGPRVEVGQHQHDAGSASPEGPVEMDYKSEAVRLASFVNWTIPFIQPSDLARAGFYSLNNFDSCKCAFCDNCVGDWVEGDDPMTEHRNLFPMCPFINGYQVGNIPLSGDDQVPTSPGHDEAGPRWSQVHREPNSVNEKGMNSMIQGGEQLGILKHSGPAHPQKATFEARLRTFRDWPPALKQKPKDLAEAGFIYIGTSDQVKCFFCDGGLRNWHSDDEPWKEHARWFNKCVFVRLIKGDDYIKSCIEEKPPEKNIPMSNSGPRSVTEDEIRQAMSQAIVKQVLSMGIDASRVKMAIKRRLESSGNPFETTDSLISAAFAVQKAQEMRQNHENANPSGAVLNRIGEMSSRRTPGASETWEIGQRRTVNNADDDMEEVEQSQDNTVSLNTQEQSSSIVTGSSSEAIVASQTISAPSSPTTLSSQSHTRDEEKCQSLPLLDDESCKKNQDLESENARLKEQRTCKICMDKEVGVVFLPCGHLCCCVNCAPSLKDCPVCRRNIQGTVRTFLS